MCPWKRRADEDIAGSLERIKQTEKPVRRAHELYRGIDTEGLSFGSQELVQLQIANQLLRGRDERAVVRYLEREVVPVLRILEAAHKEKGHPWVGAELGLHMGNEPKTDVGTLLHLSPDGMHRRLREGFAAAQVIRILEGTKHELLCCTNQPDFGKM